MLSVCGLPATEDCQQLVFSFYLWGQREKVQNEQSLKLTSLLVSSRKEGGVDQAAWETQRLGIGILGVKERHITG